MVTGAARGIGRAIALALAEAGADIAVADYHLEPFAGEAYGRLRQRHPSVGGEQIEAAQLDPGNVIAFPGGAGATELALALFMMEERWIAPSLGAATVHPDFGINVIRTRTDAKLQRVMSNSFAFGGSNIAVTLRTA